VARADRGAASHGRPAAGADHCVNARSLAPVAVEGHVRLTAYALFPEYLPEELPAYLGTSEAIVDWALF
jgi:hypothetical protein